MPKSRPGRIVAVLALALLIGLAVWGGTRLLVDTTGEAAAVETPTAPDDAYGPDDPPTHQAPPVDTPVAGDDPPPHAGDTEGAGPVPDTLRDGEHFGFVSAFTMHAVTFDPAEFLSGDEALRAAREDGSIGPGETLPNGFYIRNPDTAALSLPLGTHFEAALLDNVEIQPRTIDAATMASLYAGDTDAPWLYGPLEYLPMVLLVEGGEVVRADQTYLP